MMRVPMVLIAVGLAVLNNACSVGMTTGAAGGFSPSPSDCAPADTGPAPNNTKTITAGNRSSFSKGQHSHELKFLGGFRPSPHAFSADP